MRDLGSVIDDELRYGGYWVFAGGLAALGTGNRGGRGIVTDGPFVESKEHLAGFRSMAAPDPDVALTR